MCTLSSRHPGPQRRLCYLTPLLVHPLTIATSPGAAATFANIRPQLLPRPTTPRITTLKFPHLAALAVLQRCLRYRLTLQLAYKSSSITIANHHYQTPAQARVLLPRSPQPLLIRCGWLQLRAQPRQRSSLQPSLPLPRASAASRALQLTVTSPRPRFSLLPLPNPLPSLLPPQLQWLARPKCLPRHLLRPLRPCLSAILLT